MKRLLPTSVFALGLVFGVPVFAQEAPPPTNEGAFDALSPGGQKIVSSIYDSHLDSAVVSDSPTVGDAAAVTLTKDDIAAMKADTGWGNVYKQLQEQGLVSHKNLGQAISSHNHQAPAPAPTTVVTTASGQQIVSGGKKGKGVGAQSLKGGNANSQGGGNKFGHSKNAVVTTGAGGTVNAGTASQTTAAGANFGGTGGSKGRGKGGASHKGK